MANTKLFISKYKGFIMDVSKDNSNKMKTRSINYRKASISGDWNSYTKFVEVCAVK